MNINQVPADGIQHDLYGSYISIGATISALILYLIGIGSFLNVATAGVIFAAVMGGYKELFRDRYQGLGTPSWKDFGYTVLGGLRISLPLIAVYLCK